MAHRLTATVKWTHNEQSLVYCYNTFFLSPFEQEIFYTIHSVVTNYALIHAYFTDDRVSNHFSQENRLYLWNTTFAIAMVTCITYVYAKNSAPRADRGFLNDFQNTNSHCDIIMWAGIYNFLMNMGVCFDWNYFLYDYKMQTYWSHGAPCSTRDLIQKIWKYIICMNDNREPNGHFS